MCQNTTMRVYGARIKRYRVLCSKHIAARSSLVITSYRFATSHLRVPASVRRVYSPAIYQSQWQKVNSLACGRFGCHFKSVIIGFISRIDIVSISCEITLMLMSPDLTDDFSALVQVMAWCHQAPSHYLNQCWPISRTPYAITKPQRVKMASLFSSIPLVPN